MRKLFIQNMMSLDGFIARPDGNIEWHILDDDFNEYGNTLPSFVDTLVFGRKTYEMMYGYWPLVEAFNGDPIVAPFMCNSEKVVFSNTLVDVEWKNSRLATGTLRDEITELKNQDGKDIAVFGSATLCHDLITQDLVDEYRLLIAPVVLGAGLPQFPNLDTVANLSLQSTRQFSSGITFNIYTP